MAVRTLAHLCSTQPSPLRLDRGESGATLSHGMGEGQGVRASGEVSPNSATPSTFNLQPSTLADLRPLAQSPAESGPVVSSPAIGSSPSTFQLSAFPISAFHLSMFGPDKGDDSYEQVKSDVKQLGLETRVSFPGAVPKVAVPEALNAGDIFLNTTNHESFGVSVMEAAASGLCIVTTNVGELGLLWEHGHDALLVTPNDSQSMAAAVRRILTEPKLAERLSRNARTKAEQYDWSAIFPQWERLLAEAAGAFHATDAWRNQIGGREI